MKVESTRRNGKKKLRETAGWRRRYLAGVLDFTETLTWHCLVFLRGKPALPKAQAYLWLARLTRPGLRSLQTVSEA